MADGGYRPDRDVQSVHTLGQQAYDWAASAIGDPAIRGRWLQALPRERQEQAASVLRGLPTTSIELPLHVLCSLAFHATAGDLEQFYTMDDLGERTSEPEAQIFGPLRAWLDAYGVILQTIVPEREWRLRHWLELTDIAMLRENYKLYDRLESSRLGRIRASTPPSTTALAAGLLGSGLALFITAGALASSSGLSIGVAISIALAAILAFVGSALSKGIVSRTRDLRREAPVLLLLNEAFLDSISESDPRREEFTSMLGSSRATLAPTDIIGISEGLSPGSRAALAATIDRLRESNLE